MGSDDEKLAALSERIRQAEAKPFVDSASNRAGGIGLDFVGSVLGAGIIGALLDHAFGTSPWWLLGMVIGGFAVGIMSAWRSIRKSEDVHHTE